MRPYLRRTGPDIFVVGTALVILTLYSSAPGAYHAAVFLLLAARPLLAPSRRSTWILLFHLAVGIWGRRIKDALSTTLSFQIASLGGLFSPAALWGTVLPNPDPAQYLLALAVMTGLWLHNPAAQASVDWIVLLPSLALGMAVPCLVNFHIFSEQKSASGEALEGWAAPGQPKVAEDRATPGPAAATGTGTGTGTYRPFFALEPVSQGCKLAGIHAEDLTESDRTVILRAIQKQVATAGVEVAMNIREGCVLIQRALYAPRTAPRATQEAPAFDAWALLPETIRTKVRSATAVVETARIALSGPVHVSPGSVRLPLSIAGDADGLAPVVWMNDDATAVSGLNVTSTESGFLVEIPLAHARARPVLLSLTLSEPGHLTPRSNLLRVPILTHVLNEELTAAVLDLSSRSGLISDLTALLDLTKSGRSALSSSASLVALQMADFCETSGMKAWARELRRMEAENKGGNESEDPWTFPSLLLPLLAALTLGWAAPIEARPLSAVVPIIALSFNVNGSR